jgi:hypothetical protein
MSQLTMCVDIRLLMAQYCRQHRQKSLLPQQVRHHHLGLGNNYYWRGFGLAAYYGDCHEQTNQIFNHVAN